MTRLAHRSSVLIVAVGLASLISAASAVAQLSDVKGSKDHPMVSRYAGSVVIGYDFREFDEFIIPLGVLKRLRVGENIFELAKSQRVEGRVTRILYVGPQDRSPLESYGTSVLDRPQRAVESKLREWLARRRQRSWMSFI